MDKAQLIETTAAGAGGHGDGAGLPREDVERIVDALFGTVEHPGAIARALRNGETVVLGSFGSFHGDGGTTSFRPGKALTEFLQGEVR
ncbi:HU family DNA-binding protein [Streptomyces sp. NPDC016309]|uniref:HU family DNA-binding protein n=1 Tax=Streptomyces sp. NPDC016309 TaxID=3364965 RepID=UPI0036F89C19